MVINNRKLPKSPFCQATVLIENSDFHDHDVGQKIF